MNVALTAVSASVALLADNFWMLLLLPLVLFTLMSLVIRREEKYLAEAFGQSHLDYKTRVRRWL